MTRSLTLAALAACTLGALAPAATLAAPEAPAAAAGKAAGKDEGPKPKEGISAILGTLDWGAHHSEVLARIKADLDEKYRDRLAKTVDTLSVDRILKEKAAAFAAIEKTYIRFTGQRTGYEASLIADDFQTNNDEAVLRIDDRDAQRYYFFKNDRLWKVLVAYNAAISSAVPFPQFLEQVQSKYGKPLSVDHDDAGGKKTIVAGHWADDLTHLVVEDRTGFFGTFVMKFLDKGEGLALEQARAGKARPATPRASAATEGLVADIMGDGGEAGADVVDQLTGVDHQVDLQSGRPEYETLTPVLGDVGEVAPAQKKKARAEKRAKGDAKPAPAKSAEPYIIY